MSFTQPTISWCGSTHDDEHVERRAEGSRSYIQWRFYVGAGAAIACPVFGFAPPVWYMYDATNIVTMNHITGTSNQIKSNQIKFIKSRRTKVVTNTAITVTQHDT